MKITMKISMKILSLLSTIFLTNSENIYNYYELAVQRWCSSDYMIHGLWPQINSTSYPEYCKTVNYTKPSGDLLSYMNTYWHKCDNTLWEHEWEKHGSCMQEQIGIDEFSFFNVTLNLFLENSKLLDNCENDDCIMGCFDLDFKQITCE
jgi:ribonuclease I